MEIRYLNNSDDPMQVSAVYEQSWKHTYKDIIPQSYLDSIPVGKWATSINKPGMNNLILVDDNRIVGTSSFCKSRWEKFSDHGEIVSIYLLPECTGMGYGRKLIEFAENELMKLGFDRMLLWVLEENRNARQFYEYLGYMNSGEVLDDNIGGKALREIMYTKTAVQE
ncbi:MAG: GNAT family N-acetyltransferase [Ruminiclostridium sp.]|nr:GNAT family N-acetyltransferase [Ruminiclostridium sp.]